MMGHGGWGMVGGGGIGVFGMVLFWILAILAIVWLLRALDVGRSLPGREPERQQEAARRDPALDILRERYARGEIDSDEYERRKRDLSRRDHE